MKRLVGGAVALVLAAGMFARVGAGTTEEEKIDAVIAAVIQAYRTGDYAAMRRYYAPEATVVPSDYSPPLVGWANVEPRYRRAYANLTGVEMIRENTRIERRGKLAWAVYQWRFAGVVGPRAFGVQGHTTLIFEKRGGNWLILHNHTSAIPPPAEPPAATPPSS